MKKIPFELHTEVYTPKEIAKVLSLAVNEKISRETIRATNFLMFLSPLI